jgi:agmatine deiminase
MVTNTLFQRGFRMPAEWTAHERCWMAWPSNTATFGPDLAPVRKEYAAVARAIARFEPVVMLAINEDAPGTRNALGSDIEVITSRLDDAWVRDTGPLFVTGGKGNMVGVDWPFNGWGGQFPYEQDDKVAGQIIEIAGVPAVRAEMQFEGGALAVDGQGTAMATLQCILHGGRNVGGTQASFEQQVKDYLGVEKVIWFQQGLEGDLTQGHVDLIAAFVEPGRVVTVQSTDPQDPDYGALRNNLQVLKSARDVRGRTFDVHTLDQPPVVHRPNGSRRALSYMNFYITNGGVIVPQYGFTPHDENALATLRELFPDREVVGVSTPLIGDGGGNIHCITQQQPKPIVREGDDHA